MNVRLFARNTDDTLSTKPLIDARKSTKSGKSIADDLSVEAEYLREQRYFENLKFANSAENWQIAKRIGLVRPGNNRGECCFTQCTNVRIRVLTGEARAASDRPAESVVESLWNDATIASSDWCLTADPRLRFASWYQRRTSNYRQASSN